MDLKTYLVDKFSQSNLTSRVYRILATLIILVGLFIGADLLFPSVVGAILNILLIALGAVVVIFFGLGVLVIVGMRKEVSRILDILLEGGLTLIDFINLVKDLWHRFVTLLKDFLIFIAPILSYVVCFILYVLLMLLYKTIGKTYDVSYLTIFLTVALLVVFGLINKPIDTTAEELRWNKKFGKKFHAGIVDGLEITLFIFFLTMDATHLFFLPMDLRIPIHAQFANYDLMVRSFIFSNHFRFTAILVVISITLEIVRNVMRVVAVAQMHYKNLILEQTPDGAKLGFIDIVKISIRKSFNDAKDDIMRFITFTTILTFVFLLFPRLKLLTLAVASVTNFLLDVFMRERLRIVRGTDLITRVLGFVFKV